MCQLIAKRAGATIPKWALKLCWKKNPDGAGFAYVEGEEIKVQKGFMDDFAKFYEAYLAVESSSMLIHFRVATHGSKCEGNCHPFLIDKKLVMGHNGVLGFFTPLGVDDRSDTRIFAEDYVAKMWNKLKSTSTNGKLQDLFRFIAPAVSHNKIAFMTTDDHFYIFNEKSGDWVEDVWYSNGVPTRSSYSWNSHYGDWQDVVDEDGKKGRAYVLDPDLEGMPDSFRSGYTSPDPLVPTPTHSRMRNGNAGTTSAGSTTYYPPKGDTSVNIALRDYAAFQKGKMSETAYLYSIWYMLESEFATFLNLMCKGKDEASYDHELATVLIGDRKQALQKYNKIREENKTSNTTSTIHSTSKGAANQVVINSKGLTYPPWLEEEFKVSGQTELIYPVDARFARHLVNLERGFLIDGVIVSRAAAKRAIGMGIQCEFPKEKGVFVPIYDPKHRVFDWARVAGPTGSKLGPQHVTSWVNGAMVERKKDNNVVNNVLSLMTHKHKPVAGPANQN